MSKILFWKVTKAQYESLPESKLTDDALYFLTDEPKIHFNDITYGVNLENTTHLESGSYDAATRTIKLTMTDGSVKPIVLPEADGTNAGLMSSGNFTKLGKIDDTLLQKVVTDTIADAESASNTKIPTEKSVATLCNTILESAKALANGAGHSLTYTPKTDDEAVMQLKLLDKEGTELSSIDLHKDNFMSNFVQRTATEEDVTAGHAKAIGDPLLEVTMVNGDKFYVDLSGLVDIYKGNTTSDKGIIITVNDYIISAELKLDATTQAKQSVKLAVGANGVSADLAIDSAANDASSAKIEKNSSNGGISVSLNWKEVTA